MEGHALEMKRLASGFAYACLSSAQLPEVLCRLQSHLHEIKCMLVWQQDLRER